MCDRKCSGSSSMCFTSWFGEISSG